MKTAYRGSPELKWEYCQSVQPSFPIFNFVDPDLYSAESGSLKLLNTDQFWFWIHKLIRNVPAYLLVFF